jgi:DNA-binding MarR family transcriptional regulator
LNASTVSGIIKRLETKGLVARTPHPDDKRITLIVLTAQGAELLDNAPTTLQEKLTRRLDQLSPAVIEELHRNIDLLVNLMDAEEIDAAPVVTNREFDADFK